jgi:tetratricopeptide (TPR) repeat protein
MFSFPLFSASKSQARSGSARSGSSTDGTNRVWEVDPLSTDDAPVLRWLGSEIATHACRQEATLFLEPWLKHDGAVSVQGEHGLEEVFPLPSSMFLELRTLVKEICVIDTSAQPARRSGTGRLVVCGHTFSLEADVVLSPWGDRLVLRAKPESGPILDPVSAFPWITLFGFPNLRFNDGDFDWAKALKKMQWDAGWGRTIKHFRDSLHDYGRQCERLLTSVSAPSVARRLELLSSRCFNEQHKVRRFLFDELRTRSGGHGGQFRIVASDTEATFYRPVLVIVEGEPTTAWRKSFYDSSVARGSSQIRRVIADLAWRYPMPAEGRGQAAGVACAVGGKPLDVTIEETTGDAVAWSTLPPDMNDESKESGSPTEAVFVITIHDDSPDPPHWEHNRQQRAEEQARGTDRPSESTIIFGECEAPLPEYQKQLLQLPARGWLGWLRRRCRFVDQWRNAEMTHEDAREAVSLMEAKRYEQALAGILHFWHNGNKPLAAAAFTGIAGVLQLKLSRYEEARASLLECLEHIGEDRPLRLLLSECCERLGDDTAARSAMQQALERSGEPISIQLREAGYLDEHGFHRQAAVCYEMALKQQAVELHTAMAEENESRYKSHWRRAHPRRLAWRYAQLAAETVVSQEGIDSFVMPTQHGFAHEKETREHGGLYWQELEQPDGTRVRHYLPNYLDRFAGDFQPPSNVVKSLARILKELGRHEEAEPFFFEAKLL